MILVTCAQCGCENQIPEYTDDWEELYCELCGELLEGPSEDANEEEEEN